MGRKRKYLLLMGVIIMMMTTLTACGKDVPVSPNFTCQYEKELNTLIVFNNGNTDVDKVDVNVVLHSEGESDLTVTTTIRIEALSEQRINIGSISPSFYNVDNVTATFANATHNVWGFWDFFWLVIVVLLVLGMLS